MLKQSTKPSPRRGSIRGRTVALTLTQEELIEVTGVERPKAQARELDHLKIPYQVRRNGSLLVYRIHTAYATQEKEPESPEMLLP